ncbi:S8 family serine peptidase [Vibrio splendidus]|uniref:S8 family serine peptidase n=1 Tax=Vibrio splendidus TaxID=29497 RepID=UPI000C8601F0|nr:S8 family serine peptidase [Vibrio splendidus]PMO91174.1 peptidase S8 [Vibrio splendidus]PMP19978.1 peptidase S8 [Vibrio splendidus]PMP26994.1 peptidase S8 [Vibrio splendidus]PMP40267.1 peptidase S8 [Vibrio splendidus]PMP42504.1 peptidase S8 [Vibrio splendidus]
MHQNKIKLKSLFSLSAVTVAITFSLSAHATLLTGFDESNLPTKYIVKFKEDTSRASELSRNSFWGPRIVQESLLEQLKARKVEKLGNRAIYSVEMEDSELGRLRNRSDVEYVEIDPPRYLLSETIPWGYEAVNAQRLSDSSAGNRTVCIIDSGYDLAHNDLSGNRVSGTNDSGTGAWSDPGNNNAHGTHVAGTIAAIANAEGIKGVMPNQNVNLHIVKVFNDTGWGYSSSLIKAVQTCADNGSNVVNMSLGGSQSSMTEKNALQTISDQGVLLIAAAGNSGNTAHSYPASYDSVMSVAAVDDKRAHAAFSQATDQVEITGPGVAILSTVTVGEGKLSDIRLNGASQFDRGIVPHNRLIQSGGSYAPDPVAGSITATLASCDVAGSSFRCGDMSGKICLTERVGNQSSSSYPEIDAVQACYNAGASAAIVYSNSDLPGLQNPFLVDQNNEARMVSVTVNRAFGQDLLGYVGQEITVSTTKGENYEYYNGTSMATPHVTGVAGLVWSYHPTCTAAQVRNALIKTATDIDVTGRDNRTGYGLVNSDAAKQYLDAGCNGPDGGSEPSSYTNSDAIAIPDNQASGVVSSLDVTRSGDAGSVTIDLDITHTYIGDLYVTLTSPEGGQVVLHDNAGGRANNIKTSFQADFSGFESQGKWELKVVDSARRDTGTINSWTLAFY